MKGYEDLQSGHPVPGAKQISDIDLKMMSSETASRKEAVSKAVEAVVMLATRVMTVDSCIDIMSRRAPFANLGCVMDDMSRLCAELTADCMKVLEFCISDNVLDIQDIDKGKSTQKDDWAQLTDVVAEPSAQYGHDADDKQI